MTWKMSLLDLFRKQEKNPREAYVLRLFRNSLLATDSLHNINNLSDTQWSSVLFEFLFLYLHITDRYVFAALGGQKRDEEMNLLYQAVFNSAIDAVFHRQQKKERENMMEEARQAYNSTIAEYSQYKKLFPEKDEAPKNTLLWEFGKNIMELIKSTNPGTMLHINTLASTGLKDLEPDIFTQKLNRVN